MNISLVIATLFEPPTLPGLVASAEAQGVEVYVIKGMPTNHAWNAGIRMCSTRYCAIFNDDMVIEPEDWASRLIAHHEAGYGWVCPRIKGDPILGEYGMPKHWGHAFSLDLEAGERETIPEDLVVYYGDAYLLNWYGVIHGKWKVVEDVAVGLGADAGLPGKGGWTGGTHRKKAEAFLGMTYEERYRRDKEGWKDIAKHLQELVP